MPRWDVEGPDGTVFTVESDHEPTETELAEVFSQVSPPTQDPVVGTEGPAEGRGLYIPGVGQLPTMREAALKVADWAPTVGGVVGGTVGGIGGTVGGMGVGGLPGAIGGAGLGAAGGESARRLIREALLAEDAPTGGAEAARAIGGEAAMAGGATALGGGTLKLLSVAGKPVARGIAAAGKELIGNAQPGSITAATMKGAKAAWAAVKPADKKMLASKLEHAVMRGAKEAGAPVKQEAAKAVVKELRDEIPEFIVGLAKRPEAGGQGLTRAQIVAALKQKYGSANFSEGAAGKIVDDVAKLFDIELVTTPGAAAKVAGKTFNQTIREARAKVGS